MSKLSLSSLLVQDPANSAHAMTPPIVQSSLFYFDNCEDMEQRFRGMNPSAQSEPASLQAVYSRGDNPTVQQFEQKIAQLEGGQAARAFASGMGAISAALMSVLRAGDRVVCVRDVYADTYRLLEKLLPRYGVSTSYVDGSDTAAVIAALPGAKVLYLESPTSWTFRTQNLALLAAAAKQYGLITICDNSWATPLHQQPLAFGIDMVVHSASKYLCGHSDTVAGVVVASAERIHAINDIVQPYLGAKLAPLEAWLLLRGMRTLAIRMAAQWTSAEEIMKRLGQQAAIKQIMHPAWQRGPGNHCLTGYSGLFTLEMAESVDIRRFCNQLQLFRRGVSWGGHESLVLPAEICMAQASGPNSMLDFGLSPRCVRLYIGFEDVEDLWADLMQALLHSHTPEQQAACV